jgi:hypothetical protein
MNNDQDHDMDDSDGSLAGSSNPTYPMTDDIFTKEKTESILEAMEKGDQIDYKWMNVERSTYHKWKNIKEADKLTKKMNTLLSFWHKVNEEKRYQETAASNTAKSLKRPRSSEDGGETDRDPSINNAETDVNDTETGADTFTSFKRIKRPDRPQAIWHR